MAGGRGRKGLMAAALLGVLALLAGPVEAADGDGLSVENQLYITAGLLGGLSFVLTIAVVYLLLTLNRIQSDVFKLTDTITKQEEQQQQKSAPDRVDDANARGGPEEQPTQTELQPQPVQPQPESQQQFQPVSQPMSQQQSQPLSVQQTTFMPQNAPQSQQPTQGYDPRNSSNQQQQSSYQPATSPGYNAAPPQQQPYRGAPQRPETALPLTRESFYGGPPVASYGFPAQGPQNAAPTQQYNQSALSTANGPYGARPVSQPSPYFGSRAPAAINPHVSSGPIYPRDRY